MSAENIESYSKELIKLILAGKISSRRELDIQKIRLAKKYSLTNIPTNPTILSFCPFLSLKKKEKCKLPKRKKDQYYKEYKKLLLFLGKKKMRSLSGIVPIALMCSPHKCPGSCLYCPNPLVEGDVPKSYTGREPATMRAIQNKFDPLLQVSSRLEQLSLLGHSVEKIQLIVMGGTFLSTPLRYQKQFVTRMLNAVTGKNVLSLEKAKLFAEKSKNRVIGVTYETRPDYCKERHVNRMLEFGGTSCEIGVQILNDAVYEKISRGHTVNEVVNATRLLKDAGFKVTYHCMPGLPFTTEEDDLNSFKEMFFNPDFKPDMLKLYPCLVTDGTKLHEMWKAGKYIPLDTKQAADIIVKVKKMIPTYIRIMRIQRDIPSTLVSAGVKHSNLRQVVEEKLEEEGFACKCVRCREAGLKSYKKALSESDLNKINDLNDVKAGKEDLSKFSKPVLHLQEYSASNGIELFLSFEDKRQELLYALCRLRISENSFRKEISNNAAIIRELRVFGESLPIGLHEKQALQHKGLGQKLMKEAERIAFEQFDKKKIVVLSGLGVKEYYKKHLNYRKEGQYMAKKLDF